MLTQCYHDNNSVTTVLPLQQCYRYMVKAIHFRKVFRIHCETFPKTHIKRSLKTIEYHVTMVITVCYHGSYSMFCYHGNYSLLPW